MKKRDDLDMAKVAQAKAKLAEAISEIVNNPLTPVRLYNDVADYLSDNGVHIWDKLMARPAMINRILTEAGVGGAQEAEVQEVSHVAN